MLGLPRTGQLPEVGPRGLFRLRLSVRGWAGAAFAHALAFTAVAHCHYLIAPPNRLLWFVAELLIALVLWPVSGWLAGQIGRVLRNQHPAARWLPALCGLGLAAWWDGQIADTLWVHDPAMRPALGVLLFLARAAAFGGVAAGVVAALAATDPPLPPAIPARRSWSWATVAVFVVFLIGANALAAWYVGRESTLYYADFAFHWGLAADWANLCRHDPVAGWDQFRQTVQAGGYTLLPAVGPAAGMIAFGDQRVVFVLAVVNGYLLAAAVAAWRFTARFAPGSGWVAAAVPAGLLVTMPVAWVPILRGYYDIGGAALGVAALTVYLSRPRADLRWPQLLGVAALLVAAVLFRRWYGFWVVAFLGLVGAECGLAAVAAAARRQWADAGRAARPAVALGGVGAAIDVRGRAPERGDGPPARFRRRLRRVPL